MLYLLSRFEDSIDDKIDNPPVCFEVFCKKFDIYNKLCYNVKKSEENENGFK
jgi:hypothetical protein